MITETIQANANLSTLAAAADWAGIVAAWPVIRLQDVRVSGRQTAEGLIAAGHDWLQITTAVSATVPGQDLKTIMQSEGGINWADPLTVQSLGVLKNEVITQGVIDTLVGLSQRFAVVPTAGEVQAAVFAEAARQAYELIRNRRKAWDALAAEIRSSIESGSLVDDAAVLAAVTTGLEA